MGEDLGGERALIEADLKRIAEQERALTFERFDEEVAWTLGSWLRELALREKLPVAIDVRTRERILFACALPGSTADNWNWVRRKANLAHRVERSTYAVGLDLRLKGRTLDADTGFDIKDFAAHGGAFPIRVAAAGFIGCVTVSGLPQREDHNVAVAAVAALLGKDLPTLALPVR